jgi:lipid II:glycine glycyltransferase (peptidoglycan interpeptide bridge formation enzyme)
VDATEWSAERWDAIAVRSRRGHAFQSHAWGDLKARLGWQASRHVVEVDGQPVAAIAALTRPLYRLPRPIGSLARRLGASADAGAFLYVPRGPVLLRDDPDTATASVLALRQVAARAGARVVTVDPLWPEAGHERDALRAQGFSSARRGIQVSSTAMLIPVKADEEEQHRLLRKSTANLINRARRAGVTIERIDPGTDPAGADAADSGTALHEMHELLEATAQREGLVLRDREYQLDQWRELGAAGHATIWFATVDGKRWAGSVAFRCGETLHQYQAGSADGVDLRDIPANHLLQWEMLRWAAAQGFAYYDLGGVDTPAAPGLPKDEDHPLWNLSMFKRGFGAEGVEYMPAQERSANALVRAVWRFARGVPS